MTLNGVADVLPYVTLETLLPICTLGRKANCLSVASPVVSPCTIFINPLSFAKLAKNE